MTLREKIEVMEAFERGEKIEQCERLYGERLYGKWYDSPLPQWNWGNFIYRIKPKPKKTVTIEKWLCKAGFADAMYIIEVNKEYFDTYAKEKVKLLETYEVTL